LTQSGSVVGTPAYMAPEQARGEKVDARADLFSLGCVLYRLCTGEAPFMGETTMAVLLSLATEHPRPVRQLNPDVPAALSDLVMRLLAKDPAGRPASARAVLEELQSIKRGAGGRRPAAQSKAPPGDPPDRSEPLPALPLPKRRTAGARKRWPWVAGAEAGLMAAAALAVVLVIRGKGEQGEGTVTIETVDPDIEVTLTCNGRSFTIRDKKTKEELTLPVGRYEVALKGGKAGLKLETSAFTLKRGKQEVVRVTWAESKAPVVKKPPRGHPRPEAPGFESIFNEKDLTGWEVAGDSNRDDWSAAGGEIVLADVHPREWGWLLTRKRYRDFILRLEFKTSPGAKSGIALRADRSAGVKGANHPIKVQIVDPAHPQARAVPTGSLSWADGGNKYELPTRKPALESGWNRMEVEMRGQRVRVRVNGAEVQDLDLDALAGGTALAAVKGTSGQVGLQKHTGGARFRNIEVKELPPESLFNGRDLSGWEGQRGVWQVKEGVIFASTFPGARKLNTFLCSKEKFKDFELEFDARVRGGNNSGVMIRSKLYDTKNYWLDGIKCDLGGRTGWGTLVTYDGRNGKVLKQANAPEARETIKAEDFNRVFLRCVGRKVTVRVNGVPVHEAELAELAEEGVIAFQLRYGIPTEVSFKNIRIRRLSATGEK
jgi:hypothetical protein